ncbi:MAG: DNA polymerase/3'-5' exonuclease PolX [Actinomycetota bacterium]|nr:DNA polymerase/3'-5' exonuclease PolX [Actinomycetota bacterium]
MDKNSIIKALEEIAVMLELKNDNPFKIRAYRNAAHALETADIEINENTKIDELTIINGIGKSIAENILEFATGNNPDFYDELKESFTPQMLELLNIPTLGPKKVRYLFDNLGIAGIDDLEDAIGSNKLVDLPNFGKKTQENILKGIKALKNYKEFYLYSEAISEAQIIVEKLKAHKYIKRADIAGSLRRKKETVKDIDIVAGIAKNASPDEIMNFFVSLEEAGEEISKGETKSSVRLKSGINADLRIVDDDMYPYLLHHFTGSKEHNTALRGFAKDRDIKINEYGIFKKDKLIKCSNEKEIYGIFNMEYIEPELREDNGEIEAALNAGLPELVKMDDIKGIFHLHTTFSDGSITLRPLCEKMIDDGYEYVGITDHSQSAYYAGGVKSDAIEGYIKAIGEFCASDKRIKIFKGIESDIRIDGSLDYSEEILKKFDFIIASIHSNFTLPEEEMTNRVIKAIENKYTTILGHPTGRILLTREPYKIDMIRVINAAAENNVAIEINANPFRLDLDWRLCKYAKSKKVKIFICPDAHKIEDIDNTRFGVNIARKGWLEKSDIANTLNAEEMTKFFNNLKISKNIQ